MVPAKIRQALEELDLGKGIRGGGYRARSYLFRQEGLPPGTRYYIRDNMIVDERRAFGNFLREVRANKNLTLRDLARRSGVPFPNISAIECGRLGAGRIVARKLAAGLGLRGSNKEQFLDHAAFTNSRDRLSKEHLGYPGVVANLLPGMLRRLGIEAHEIVRTVWENPELIENARHSVGVITLYQPSPKPELANYLKRELDKNRTVVLFLTDGRQVLVRGEVRIF